MCQTTIDDIETGMFWFTSRSIFGVGASKTRSAYPDWVYDGQNQILHFLYLPDQNFSIGEQSDCYCQIITGPWIDQYDSSGYQRNNQVGTEGMKLSSWHYIGQLPLFL